MTLPEWTSPCSHPCSSIRSRSTSTRLSVCSPRQPLAPPRAPAQAPDVTKPITCTVLSSTAPIQQRHRIDRPPPSAAAAVAQARHDATRGAEVGGAHSSRHATLAASSASTPHADHHACKRLRDIFTAWVGIVTKNCARRSEPGRTEHAEHAEQADQRRPAGESPSTPVAPGGGRGGLRTFACTTGASRTKSKKGEGGWEGVNISSSNGGDGVSSLFSRPSCLHLDRH